MEYESKNEAPSINDFDFMSKIKKEKPEKSKINYSKFLNLSKNTMIAAGVSLVIVATTVGGYNIYQSNVDSKIASAELLLKAASSQKIINYLAQEKEINEKQYISNQLLINQYGALKDVVEVLNKQQEVANYQLKNTQIYNETLKSFNTDMLAINTVFMVFNSNLKTREDKVSAYVNNNNVNVLKKWNDALMTHQVMYVNNIIDLHQKIKNSVGNIEQVKKDILEQVQNRIKNNDFDLNSAQTSFSTEVVAQTQTQLNELNQAKKELYDLKDKTVQNADGSITKTDPNMQNIITDKDLNEASEALTTYQNEAINQINGDREKVEQLIADAKKQEQSNNEITNTNSHINNDNIHNNVNKGPSFLDYYLMYSWLNSGSRTTINNTNINKTIPDLSHNYPKNNSYKTQSQDRQINKASYKSVNIPKPNMYDMNNNNSYLNKQLEKSERKDILTKGTFGKSIETIKSKDLLKYKQMEKSKIDIRKIRSKIAESKIKIEEAKNVRQKEIKKLETAKTNKYESSLEKSYKKNKISVDKTNIKSTNNDRNKGFGSSRSKSSSSKKR